MFATSRVSAHKRGSRDVCISYRRITCGQEIDEVIHYVYIATVFKCFSVLTTVDDGHI